MKNLEGDGDGMYALAEFGVGNSSYIRRFECHRLYNAVFPAAPAMPYLPRT